jgi:hypothetical protein
MENFMSKPSSGARYELVTHAMTYLSDLQSVPPKKTASATLQNAMKEKKKTIKDLTYDEFMDGMVSTFLIRDLPTHDHSEEKKIVHMLRAEIKKEIMSKLQGYADSRPFIMASKSCSLNAEINRLVAREIIALINSIKQDASLSMHSILSKDHIKLVRLSIIEQHGFRTKPGYVEREINSKTLNDILDDARQFFPVPKKQRLQDALIAYTDRVLKNDHGFVFFIKSRTRSRQVNTQLALRLRTLLDMAPNDAAVGAIFTPENVKKLRDQCVPDLGFQTFKDCGINSAELNAVLSLARTLFPAEPDAAPAFQV